MYKSKIRTSLYVLIGIFMSAVSMQAQAWSYGVSWYSDINFTFSTKGNKLKLANGNYVVSEIYAFNYVSICIATNSGKQTIQTGLGNNGSDVVVLAEVVKESSDDSGKNKGTFTATGTIPLTNMYKHYREYSVSSPTLKCYEDDVEVVKADGTTYMKPGAPTGYCTEADRDWVNHPEHFCHAEADQKVEYRDNLYMPQVAVYVRVVEGNDDGTPPEPPYNVISQGIAECVYTGDVSQDINGEFVTTTEPTDCDVTEYPLTDPDTGEALDPRFVHVLSF